MGGTIIASTKRGLFAPEIRSRSRLDGEILKPPSCMTCGRGKARLYDKSVGLFLHGHSELKVFVTTHAIDTNAHDRDDVAEEQSVEKPVITKTTRVADDVPLAHPRRKCADHVRKDIFESPPRRCAVL